MKLYTTNRINALGLKGPEKTPKAIKKFRSDLPIIAQTAFSYNHEDREIIEAGCQRVITKPISPKVLINSIRDYLETR